MFAWILKQNAVNLSSIGSTTRSSAPTARGEGALATRKSSNSCTPTVLYAEPKNTGANSPRRYASLSNFGYTSSAISRSSASLPLTSLGRWSNANTLSNFRPCPFAHVTGVTLICNSRSTSSIRSNGSLPSRSILFMNTITGVLRIRQTSIRRRVCVSTPLAESITTIALSTAVSVRNVSSAKSW